MHCLMRLAMRSWSVRPAGCARSGIMPPGTACIMASLFPNRASASHSCLQLCIVLQPKVQLGLKSGNLCMPRAPSDIRAAAHARCLVYSHDATRPCQKPDGHQNMRQCWQALCLWDPRKLSPCMADEGLSPGSFMPSCSASCARHALSAHCACWPTSHAKLDHLDCFSSVPSPPLAWPLKSQARIPGPFGRLLDCWQASILLTHRHLVSKHQSGGQHCCWRFTWWKIKECFAAQCSR